jgi:hypothetical protein
MYWSRKFKISNCTTKRKCNYIGIPKNDKRHAIRYNLSDCNSDCSKIRKNRRVRNNKEEMEALRNIGIFNDVYRNRRSVDGANSANIRCNRSLVHIYKRNQPSSRGKAGNDNSYSYSYNEFLRIKKMSYKNSLPTKEPADGTFETSGNRGKCDVCDDTAVTKKYKNRVIWKPNNKKYGVQGAVSSSSRLDRLRLETIRGSKRCENDNTICDQKYFAGKPRFDGYIFNKDNKESCHIQNKARSRVRGNTKNFAKGKCY